MKKIYLLIVAVGFISAAGFAQVRDTLTNHWDRMLPLANAIDTAVVYKLPGGTGYIAGMNSDGDKAMAQKFDPSYGVSQGGTVEALLLWFGAKIMGSGSASFAATIWSDNGGKPGTALGITQFNISSIDTSYATQAYIGVVPTAIRGAYNVIATFPNPIAIPANKTFWAGVSFTYASGDYAGFITSRDKAQGDAPGLTGNCPEASAYTFEQRQDGTWLSFNDGTGIAGPTWAMDIAFGIFPVVQFGAVGINEPNSLVASLANMPNPAADATTIVYQIKAESDVTLSVFDVTGKELVSLNQGIQGAGAHSVKISVSELPAGMYFYTLHAGNSIAAQKLIIAR